jgi:signal transduction histidine kinase
MGQLIGGVAHDLNNALTSIVGYTELASATLENSHPARADVEEIRRAAGRAEAVTRQLLAFSRKRMLERQIFSIGETVSGITRMLERILGANITLHTQIEQGLPPVYGDPGQVEQAIVNLAVNARDAMPQGGSLIVTASLTDVTDLEARARPPLRPGGYVLLVASDTGTGMSPETRAHAFEAFFTTKAPGKGTGLGLSMVYGTVKQSGGFIFVDSELGRGSSFRLYFPPAHEDRANIPTPPA